MAKFAFVLDAWCEKATELKRQGVTSLSPVGEGERVTTQSLSLDESGGHAGESGGIGRPHCLLNREATLSSSVCVVLRPPHLTFIEISQFVLRLLNAMANCTGV
jgi:hypothetical protein